MSQTANKSSSELDRGSPPIDERKQVSLSSASPQPTDYDPCAVPTDDVPDRLTFQGFFFPMFVSDEEERRNAMADIIQQLQESACAPEDDTAVADVTALTNGLSLQPQQPPSDKPGSDSPAPPATEESAPKRRNSESKGGGFGRKLVLAHVRSVARLAAEAPYEDVVQEFSKLVAFLKEKGIAVPPPVKSPSFFVASKHIPSLLCDNQQTRHLFEDIFLATGRVSHMEQILGWHPSFLQCFTTTTHYIMRDDGPLPLTWRHYIAMMAASRYKCEYLINLEEQEFLQNGGDKQWLLGLKHSPKKLQNLSQINALLAHQPWSLDRKHIEELVKGGDVKGDHWSISELVHAIVILCTFHSLCGLVYGMAVVPEVDMQSGLTDAQFRDLEAEEKLANEAVQADMDASSNSLLELLKTQSPSLAPRTNSAKPVDSFALTGPPPDIKVDVVNAYDCPKASAFAGNNPLVYSDFDTCMKTQNAKVFRMHDYSWKEHGYTLVNRFYAGVGPLIDKELDLIYNLTYKDMHNSKNLDTGPFRRALWYYTHRLYGALVDDYDYHDVNKFMIKAIKTFVKKVACHPQTVTFDDFRYTGLNLRPDEKCHIVLLALEAHKSAALLYGLHAVMKHMTLS